MKDICLHQVFFVTKSTKNKVYYEWWTLFDSSHCYFQNKWKQQHSVEKEEFFCHSYFMWNSIWKKNFVNNGLFNKIMSLDFVQFQLEFLDFYTVYNNKCLNGTFHQTWSQCR